MSAVSKVDVNYDDDLGTDAEVSALGSALHAYTNKDTECGDKVLNELREYDFSTEVNRVIFSCMKDIRKNTSEIDTLTLADEIESKGKQDVVGIYHIGIIMSRTMSSKFIDSYIDIVKKESSERKLKEIINKAQETIDSPGKINEKIDKVSSIIGDIQRLRRGKDYQSAQSVFAKLASTVDERIANRDKNIKIGIYTGFDELDNRFNGLRGGDLIIVAGRPSMGKTTLAYNIAEYVVIKEKKKALVFSLEMTSEQLMEKTLANLGNIDLRLIRNGRLSDNEVDTLFKVNTILSDVKLFIDDKSGITVDEICGKARQVAQENNGIDLIVIDYLGLIRTDRKNNSVQEIAYITGELKKLAKELCCAIILLAQLNRGLEARENKRPFMSDLRDSGSIEQDADIIMFVYRDEYYHNNPSQRGIAEIITAKFRNGETGTDYLRFVGNKCRFENIKTNGIR